MQIARTTLLFTVLLVGITDTAAAQWSISAFLGNAWTHPDVLRIESSDDTDVRLGGVRYEDRSFRSPIYYGARVTRFFRRVPWLGMEGEFVHLKTISSPTQTVEASGRFERAPVGGPAPLGRFLPHFELSHGLNLLLANAVVRLPVIRDPRPGSASRVALSLRGGLGPTVPHVEGRFQNYVEDQYQISSKAWQTAAGIEVRLRERLLAVTEVKWTSTHQRVTIGAAQIDGAFRTGHAIVGLSWEIPIRVDPAPHRDPRRSSLERR